MWLRGRAQPTPKRTFLDRATAAIAKVMDAPRGAVDAAGRALGDGARAIVNFLATFACLIGAPVLSVIGQWQTALALFLLGLGVWIWLRLGNLGLVMLGIAIVGAGVGVRLSHAESVIKHWLGY
jgi:hypothetical protein